jgi:hypothetical protein
LIQAAIGYQHATAAADARIVAALEGGLAEAAGNDHQADEEDAGAGG